MLTPSEYYTFKEIIQIFSCYISSYDKVFKCFRPSIYYSKLGGGKTHKVDALFGHKEAGDVIVFIRGVGGI